MERQPRFWFDTASGSRYLIDPGAGRWARLTHDERSGDVRSVDGELHGYEGPDVGAPFVIYGPSWAFAGGTRVITTTPVTAVYFDEPDSPPASVLGWWDEKPAESDA